MNAKTMLQYLLEVWSRLEREWKAVLFGMILLGAVSMGISIPW